jgi:hypothetical protein
VKIWGDAINSELPAVPLLSQDACPRCGIETGAVYLKAYGQCRQCNLRDEEERKAWSCYFRGFLETCTQAGDVDLYFEAAGALADGALETYQKRFPYPEKK